MIASGRDSVAKVYDANGAAALAQAPPPIREPLDGFLKQALHDFGAKVSDNSVLLSGFRRRRVGPIWSVPQPACSVTR